MIRDLDRPAPACVVARPWRNGFGARKRRPAIRGIKVFFSSLAGIEGMPADLLDRTAHPKVPETPIAVVEEGATRRLMHSLNGKAFEDRRDQAVAAPLVHTGVRLAALAGLRVEDRNTDGRRSTVPGKGGKYRPGRRPVVLAGRLQLPATPTAHARQLSRPARPTRSPNTRRSPRADTSRLARGPCSELRQHPAGELSRPAIESE